MTIAYSAGFAPYAASLHIQELLNSFGAHLKLDGSFGPLTTAAVEAFQSANGLAADGIVGIVTLTALKNPASKRIPKNAATGGLVPIDPSQVTFNLANGGQGALSYSAWSAYRDAAMAFCGIAGGDSDALDIIASHESSYIVDAVNSSDSNATGPIVSDGKPQKCSRGLMQTIFTTFAGWHGGGTSTDIYDPHANIVAAIFYAIGTYGSVSNVPGVVSVRGGGGYVGY